MIDLMSVFVGAWGAVVIGGTIYCIRKAVKERREELERSLDRLRERCSENQEALWAERRRIDSLEQSSKKR